jgi:hypothetical protein
MLRSNSSAEGRAMSIVQFPNPDTGLFQIVLPEQATVAQKALKEKIDELLESLKQRQSEGDYTTWVANLETIAKEGFDASQADPQAAMEKVHSLAEAVTRPKSDGVPPTRQGAYKIRLPDCWTAQSDKGIGWQEILFEVTNEVFPIPPDQLKLKADIETTMMTLKAILHDKNDKNEEALPKTMTANQHRYAAYQIKLLGIAETGLQTPADPNSARQPLEALQADILLREGPRVKNRYMKRLGVAAAALAAVSAVAYLVLRNNPQASDLLYAYRNLFVLLTGTMIGTWLSFGLRRSKIVFKDLSALEEDMMEPAVRLIFTGLIAITIAFVFATGMVNVTVGGLNSAHLLANGSSALLIGMLLGVSELALPGVLTRRASQFVSEVGGKA